MLEINNDDTFKITPHQALIICGSLITNDQNGYFRLFGVESLDWSTFMHNPGPGQKPVQVFSGVNGAKPMAKFLRVLADKLDEAQNCSKP